MGKPSVDFVALAVRSATAPPGAGSTWVVGDDATTDIAMGIAAGMRTVQVRTGKYGHQSADPSLPRGQFLLDSVANLPELLRTQKAGRSRVSR